MNIAIVTGAAKGIGKAITARLMKEKYFVIAVDVDKIEGEALEKEFGKDNVKFSATDICNEVHVQQLFSACMKVYKRIDVVVNNAGVLRDNMIWKMSVEDFDAVINVNLKGTWLMCREAAKVMKEQNHGRIVNIASRAW